MVENVHYYKKLATNFQQFLAELLFIQKRKENMKDNTFMI